MHNVAHVYRAGLTMPELIAAVRRLLDDQRSGERLLCRYLADLADRVEARGVDIMGGYADIYHAAHCLFGLSKRRTRECVRIGRALRSLPSIEHAYLHGELSYSRVREVTRVARPEDETRWLRLAADLPMRILEQRVTEAGGPPVRADRTGEPAEVSWQSPDTVQLRLTLRADVWALLQRAMETARLDADCEALLTDAEALEAVAREALGRQAERAPADLRRAVVLYQCTSCRRTELETDAGPIEIAPEHAAALACGAPVHDLASEGRFERRGGPMPAAVARAVRLRDRHRCRVPGCTRRRYVDVHHLQPRAAGGAHSRSNCLCLCDTHHRMLHDGQLHITGDAERALEFRGADGHLLLERASATHIGPTQGGSEALASPDAELVLATMGRRGGWHVDAICDATGLTASAVTAAMAMCEIAGRVRGDPNGRWGAA